MPHELLHKTIPALWLLWLAFWVVSARSAKTNEWRESDLSRWLHGVPILIGAAIMTFPTLLPPPFEIRQFKEFETVYWLCAVIVALGLGFACYARVALGRNWSASVTLKREHELVVTGAYRYVRHPIYAGILFALLGSAIETAAWRGIIGFAAIVLAIIYKYKTEERALVRKFGADYEWYRDQVPALIPFWPAKW
ncbi:MAG: isoprenylcysteine carboxylmethyltransferase family protein [Proteobacteria bacterium]|nr:isoprenylcysteine carboxylmethyltransferase family protein [Pseudomonadota bacterium]